MNMGKKKSAYLCLPVCVLGMPLSGALSNVKMFMLVKTSLESLNSKPVIFAVSFPCALRNNSPPTTASSYLPVQWPVASAERKKKGVAPLSFPPHRCEP